jgi:hypothetical protein
MGKSPIYSGNRLIGPQKSMMNTPVSLKQILSSISIRFNINFYPLAALRTVKLREEA